MEIDIPDLQDLEFEERCSCSHFFFLVGPQNTISVGRYMISKFPTIARRLETMLILTAPTAKELEYVQLMWAIVSLNFLVAVTI